MRACRLPHPLLKWSCSPGRQPEGLDLREVFVFPLKRPPWVSCSLWKGQTQPLVPPVFSKQVKDTVDNWPPGCGQGEAPVPIPRGTSLAKALQPASSPEASALTLGLGSGEQASEAWRGGPRREGASPSCLALGTKQAAPGAAEMGALHHLLFLVLFSGH